MFYFQLNEYDFGRLLLIYVFHLFVSFIFLFLAYKILNRNKNRLTIILSGFYISEGIALILNAIYPPLRTNPLVQIIYFIMAFLFLFGPIFLVLFNINLLHLDTKSIAKKQYVFIILYIIGLILLLNLPGGITINKDTNWRPVYSWLFLIILYIFTLSVIVIPFIYLFLKIYKRFEDSELKKKYKYFFIGFCGISFSFYGMILYNTWNNPIFRLIWFFATLFVLIPSALMIYYAWTHQL